MTTPKILAFWALATTAGVRPYFGWSSAIARSTPNRAKKTGSCATTGRHPASGFAPLSLYSFMVSSLSFCLSPLYFFFSSATWGASAVIFRVACICLMNSGTSSSRISTTRMTIDSAHAAPLESPKMAPSPACRRMITHATASYRGVSGLVTTSLLVLGASAALRGGAALGQSRPG